MFKKVSHFINTKKNLTWKFILTFLIFCCLNRPYLWSIQNSILAECIIWWRKYIVIYSDSFLAKWIRQRRAGDHSGVVLLSFHGSEVAWSGQVHLGGREQVPELVLPLRAVTASCSQTFPWSSILRCHWLGHAWVQHGQFTWGQQSAW